jgi:hypothetical protein
LLEDELSDVSESDLGKIFKLNVDGQSMIDPGANGVMDFHAPATLYNKVETLPPVCESPVLSNWQAGYQRDPQRDFDIFWQTFDDHYLSFDLKGVDWSAVYEQGLTSVSNSSSDAELMEVFLSDDHTTCRRARTDYQRYAGNCQC